jgi:hypothetical protein
VLTEPVQVLFPVTPQRDVVLLPAAENEPYFGPEQTVTEEVAVGQPDMSMMPISGSHLPPAEVALAVAVKPPEISRRVQVEDA